MNGERAAAAGPRTLIAVGSVTVAPLALAAAGLVHPHALTASTAAHWADLHVWLLPVFPLVCVGFVVPLWGRPTRTVTGLLTVLGWLAAFGYACFYTGLDAVAGIAAGTAARSAPPGTDLGPLVTPLFQAGDALGHIGAWAFLIAVAACSTALLLRVGVRVLPGAVVLLGAGYSFLDSHIFWPRGVWTMVAFAVGFGWLAGVTRERGAATTTSV